MANTNPPCAGCQQAETKCARIGGCCDLCTHTFDGGATRGYICADCGTVHYCGYTGPIPEQCEQCYMRRTGQKTKRVNA